MLNQCEEIEAPHPPHILQIFQPLMQAYQQVFGKIFFTELVRDICDYVNVNPVRWQNFNCVSAEVIQHCKTETVVAIFNAIYTLKAQQKQAKYWCCKSMANLYFIPEIERENLQPFYIHLIRDGRDVAASFKNAIVGDKHVYFLAKQWQKEQQLAEEYGHEFAPERYVQIKYEDFIHNPQTTLEPVLNRLGIAWTQNILEYFKGDEAKSTAASGTMWSNVVNPVDRNNKNTFIKTLSESEIQLYETIAAHTLIKFGYGVEPNVKKNISETEIEFFKLENEIMKTNARNQHTTDVKSRSEQEKTLLNIRQKLSNGILSMEQTERL